MRNARQGGERLGVDLARIRLSGDDVIGVEAHLFGDTAFQFAHLVVIAGKQFKEAGLRAGGALHAAEPQRRQTVLYLVEIERQVVGPEARALSNRRGLRRLQMRESQAGQVAILLGKNREPVDDRDQAPANQAQRLPQQQQIGVVGHITTGSAQVDNGTGLRAQVAIGVHVRHHVVPQAPFVLAGVFKIDVVQMGLQLFDLQR